MQKLIFFLLILSYAWTSESITSTDGSYRNICTKALTDSWIFQNFRCLSDYTHVVEIPVIQAKPYADYLLKKASPKTLEKMKAFRRLEELGNPPTVFYRGLGNFSATTLRYILVADHIKKLFSLPNHAKIAEIGAGFGGQCFILSQLQSFSKYYIYDLPEVEALIEKVLGQLSMQNVIYLPLERECPEEIDLVISNFAFSECTLPTQLEYFENVIKKAKRGYMLYNQIADRIFGLECLSPSGFVELLKRHGIHAKIYKEPVKSAPDNVLIVWDQTRKE